MAASRIWSFCEATFFNIPPLFQGISQRHISRDKTILKKFGYPEKPKQPANPYILYYKKIKPQIMAENPGLSSKEVFKIISQQWKELPDQERDNYREEFKENLATYKNNYEQYKKSLTEEQSLEIRELLESYKMAKKEKLATDLQKKLHSELNRPKRPQCAFFLFRNEHISKTGKLPMQEKVKLLAEEWNNISEREKEKYVNLYKINLQAYQKDLKKWEEKMIKEGHVNMVRRSTSRSVKNSE